VRHRITGSAARDHAPHGCAGFINTRFQEQTGVREQLFFGVEPATANCVRRPIPDAELTFFERAFSSAESDHYFDALTRATPWRHDEITIHGRTIPLPRLQAWYAEAEAVLNYSGMRVPACVWTDDLLSIKRRINVLTGLDFNGVLLNYYRDGNDSVGWHSDNEVEFGPHPIIASVSFGATREFVLKHARDKTAATVSCALTHGSLLLMGRTVQNFWKHQLPKRKRVTEPRLNLTFRTIVGE
jgi:alkylated DNA repair dioxygenase AlkB